MIKLCELFPPQSKMGLAASVTEARQSTWVTSDHLTSVDTKAAQLSLRERTHINQMNLWTPLSTPQKRSAFFFFFFVNSYWGFSTAL